jgi:DnaJ-domain-containing protein 1
VRDHPSLRRVLSRGELARLIYRLGRHAATGVLTIRPRSGPAAAGPGEVLVLRRGRAVVGEGELARKALAARLARLAAHDDLELVFEGGAAVAPPGAPPGVPLADWARAHLEAQLDGALAEALVQELAGIRLTLRPELAPEPADEADRRMLAAMAQPRRLDQIWPLARTPRFRLLAFLHFLRAVDALEGAGVAAAERAAPPRPVAARVPDDPVVAATTSLRSLRIDPRRRAALRTLGVADGADIEAVKRAYRRLARALHPDLQPDADGERRRLLERRFAEVTAAYEALA